jgi:SAM-dependent methyltransferase
MGADARELEIARCVAALRANPVDLEAHNTLERLQAPQSFGRWMHVNCVIDPRDDIFRFFVKHEVAKNPLREYLSDGWRTMAELMFVLESIDRPLLKMDKMLEFASGFGRFTRHLVRAMPGKVTVSDVVPGSMEFAAREFGVCTLPSFYDPTRVRFDQQYDLIFVLSLFTHLPPDMWTPWLRTLYAGLAPNGVLLVSVHNEAMARELGLRFNADGTLYIHSSESASLDAETYGTTYTTREFVEATVNASLGRHPLGYFERAFWVGQDAVAIACG